MYDRNSFSDHESFQWKDEILSKLHWILWKQKGSS